MPALSPLYPRKQTSLGCFQQSQRASAPSILRPDGDHIVGRLLPGLAIVGPLLHQLAALLDDVAALVCALQRIALKVGQAKLDDLPRIVRAFGRPSLEGRADAMCG